MKECKECKFYIGREALPAHASFLVGHNCTLQMKYTDDVCISRNRFEQNKELVIIRKSW